MTVRAGRAGRPWRTVRAQVLDRDGWVCQLCGRPIVAGLRRSHPLGPSVDHRTPLGMGGDPLDPANLRAAHFGCNSSRGNRTVPRRVARLGTLSRRW